MKKDTQMRKALLTINNPKNSGFDQEKIKEIIKNHFPTSRYYCMADEVGGKENTYHTHLFIMFSSTVRFSQIKKYFPTAHLENVKGTPEQNREYVFKLGKWENTDKALTNLKETHFESDTLPEQSPGKSNDLSNIYQLIKEGETTSNILEAYPQHFHRVNTIEQVRQKMLYEQYKNQIRPIFVVYVHGRTGTGKTRLVYERHPPDSIFKVTDYKHPFDRYDAENVLFLDEFRSSLPIGDMLQYLDIYPTILPARYVQKQACYDMVYIISNDPLEHQYSNLKYENPKTWKAFHRRIDMVINLDDFLKKYSSYEETVIVLNILIEQEKRLKQALFEKKQQDSINKFKELRS